MLTFCGPLAVLVILVTDVSTLVPPPENVTVSCKNFRTIVYWNYSEPSPQTFFDLKITGDNSLNDIRNIKQHHYDLSDLIWNTEELDRYFVNITANDGTETSSPQESSLFTFNRRKTAIIHCELDFPDVDLPMMDDMVKVSFKNPYHLYPELKRSHMCGDDISFHWKVYTNNSHEEILHEFYCKKEKCGEEFIVPEKKQNNCFSFEGDAMEHRLAFKRKGPICILHENKINSQTIYLPIIFSLIVLGAIILITCWKFWGKQNQGLANFPKSLASLLSNTHGKNCHMHLPFESMSLINSIEPDFTQTQSLLEMPEQNIPEDIGIPESGYDRKHVVEMSPGDVVSGYGPA
ncbi:interferon gamma receptor 1 [Esox lucius]|uniref:Fibronectin type-III domain-containing protein n=1 Tax=Esox lucius TaxID=8010 RepID=A0A6Q2YRN6_ESOLU|nr:interferon gamma receptor 1 [Esox lucius]